MNDIASKRKPKTVEQKLKNFSPIVFEAKPIEWNSAYNKEIYKLKSLFSFRDDFDLHAHLANMSVEIATLMEQDRLKPTKKETCDYLKKLKTKTTQSIASLKKVKTLLPIPVKNKILELNHLFEIAGPQHRKLIAENTPCSFTAMNEARKTLEFLCDEESLNRLVIDLLGLLRGIEISQSIIPSPKAGRKEDNLETGIIHTLVYIYVNGTGLKAKCNWDPEQDKYAGKFYEFLLKAIELLGKHTKIKPLSEKTWGKYAREVIKYHYRKQ